MKINAKILKNTFFQLSYILSFLATWIIAEVFLSMYSWWYSFDPVGFQIILIPACSAPLYLISFILRKTTSPSIKLSLIKKYGDLIFPIIGAILIFSSKGNEIVFFSVLPVLVLSSLATHFIMERSHLKRKVVYVMQPIAAIIVIVATYIIAR